MIGFGTDDTDEDAAHLDRLLRALSPRATGTWMKIKHLQLGATGKFPRGPADATDEGELRLAVAADHHQGIVRIVFGKPIAWLGLPSNEARAFARLLTDHADELDRRRT